MSVLFGNINLFSHGYMYHHHKKDLYQPGSHRVRLIQPTTPLKPYQPPPPEIRQIRFQRRLKSSLKSSIADSSTSLDYTMNDTANNGT